MVLRHEQDLVALFCRRDVAPATEPKTEELIGREARGNMYYLARKCVVNSVLKKGWETSFATSVTVLFVFCALFTDLADGRNAPSPAESTSLSSEAQCSISAMMGRDIPAYQAKVTRGGRIEADNARQKLTANFTVHGVEVVSGRQNWTMVLQSYGYGDALQSVIAVAPRASSNRVEYRRGALTEWYLNGPFGLEQGITVQERPAQADGKPLTVAFAIKSNLAAAVDENEKGFTLTHG